MNILWDFDGTLFDTYPALLEGFMQLAPQKLDQDEVLKWLKKDSKTAFKHYGISEDQRGKYEELYNYYSKQIVNRLITSRMFYQLLTAMSSSLTEIRNLPFIFWKSSI